MGPRMQPQIHKHDIIHKTHIHIVLASTHTLSTHTCAFVSKRAVHGCTPWPLRRDATYTCGDVKSRFGGPVVYVRIATHMESPNLSEGFCFANATLWPHQLYHLARACTVSAVRETRSARKWHPRASGVVTTDVVRKRIQCSRHPGGSSYMPCRGGLMTCHSECTCL